MADNLQETLTTDTDSEVIDWTGNKPGYFEGRGTFDGATLTLKHSTDNGSTWITTDSVDLAFTANGAYGFRLPPCKLKATLSGVGTTSVTAFIRSVDV